MGFSLLFCLKLQRVTSFYTLKLYISLRSDQL